MAAMRKRKTLSRSIGFCTVPFPCVMSVPITMARPMSCKAARKRAKTAEAKEEKEEKEAIDVIMDETLFIIGTYLETVAATQK